MSESARAAAGCAAELHHTCTNTSGTDRTVGNATSQQAASQRAASAPFRIALVYIAEAHASDQWPINSTLYAGPGNSVRAHRTVGERIATCKRMLAALDLNGCDVDAYVDSMDDGFLTTFACWPTRLFGIGRDGLTIERIAVPNDASFELSPMLEWLHEAAAHGE